jgi:hypothetical protein
MKTLKCSLDPKNSGIIYQTNGIPINENMGFNDFEKVYHAKRVYPKNWGIDPQELVIRLVDIEGERPYYFEV